MKLFEIFLAPGKEEAELLSAETLSETGAQIFTPKEAAFIGLDGVPDDPEGRPRKLIACKPGDERLIVTRLEANDAVASFKLHELA
jgi:hypothetical protein